MTSYECCFTTYSLSSFVELQNKDFEKKYFQSNLQLIEIFLLYFELVQEVDLLPKIKYIYIFCFQ